MPEPARTPSRSPRPAAAHLSRGQFQRFEASNGVTLTYHLVAHGGNGLMVYLDGDGTENFETGGHGAALDAEAAARGVDFLFVDHPDDTDSWWDSEDADDWAEALGQLVHSEDARNIALVTYSGGSEFLAHNFLPQGTDWLPKNTVVTMIGGGGIADRTPEPPGASADIRLHWVAGIDDKDSEPDSDWSGLRVAEETQPKFAAAGYTHTRLTVTCNDHGGYDFAAVVGAELDELIAYADPASIVTEPDSSWKSPPLSDCSRQLADRDPAPSPAPTPTR